MQMAWLLGGVAAGAFLTMSATAASAETSQGSQPPQVAEIEELIVTARKIEEDVQDIPVAVTALTGRKLESVNFRAVRDLPGLVPSMNVRQDSSNPAGQIISLRGQVPPEITLTVDPAVALYVDNVLLPRSYGLRGAMVDLERAEALRGPQGTLYGKNTPGGAIGFITKDPISNFGASVTAGLGNYGSSSFTGILNVPINDAAGLRIVANRTFTDGYGHDGLDRQLAGESQSFARIKFLGEWGHLTVRAFASATQVHNDGGIYKLAGLVPANGATPEGGNVAREVALEVFSVANATTLAQAADILRSYVGGDPYTTGGTLDSRGKSAGKDLGLDLTYEVSDDLRVRSITGYRWLSFLAPLDLDGTPYQGSHPIRSSSDKFFSQELQLLGGDETFNWVAGLYGSNEKGQEYGNTQNLMLLLTPRGVRNQTIGDITSKSIAGYGQFNWQFTPDWSLTLGARYTTQDQGLVSYNRTALNDVTVLCNVPAALLATPGVCKSRKLSNTFSEPTWTASLTYALAENATAYVKGSHGFRSGGQNYRGAGSVTSFQFFRPETVNEYEVGVKTELFERKLRLNLAAYHDEISDVQRSVTVAVPGTGQTATVITNAAKARVNGVEAEGAWRLSRALTLNASVGVISPKYLEFSDFTGDRSNEDWPAPDVTYNLNATYFAPTSLGDVTATVSWSGQSKLNMFPSSKNKSQVTQKSYGLLSGRLSLDIPQHDATVSLFGRNLLDKTYAAGAVGLEAIGVNTLLTGEPRTWGFELVKRFGAL